MSNLDFLVYLKIAMFLHLEFLDNNVWEITFLLEHIDTPKNQENQFLKLPLPAPIFFQLLYFESDFLSAPYLMVANLVQLGISIQY